MFILHGNRDVEINQPVVLFSNKQNAIFNILHKSKIKVDTLYYSNNLYSKIDAEHKYKISSCCDEIDNISGNVIIDFSGINAYKIKLSKLFEVMSNANTLIIIARESTHTHRALLRRTSLLSLLGEFRVVQVPGKNVFVFRDMDGVSNNEVDILVREVEIK